MTAADRPCRSCQEPRERHHLSIEEARACLSRSAAAECTLIHHGYRPPTRKPLPIPERNVLRCCLEWLAMQGILAWRQNSGAMKVKAANRRRGHRFIEFTSIRGVSDILAVLPPHGRLAAIEVKRSDGGKGASPDQARFLEHVRAMGGIGIVVSSVDELEEELAPYVRRHDRRIR